MSDLDDAISTTGAASGKVLSQAIVTISGLTAPQKTALGAFVQTLTAWPGSPNNIQSLVVSRGTGSGLGGSGTLTATLTGYIVHSDAPSAVAQKNAGAVTQILGSVP